MNTNAGYWRNASNAGGWRDSQLRKNLNDESTDTIWNAIQSADFKNNITPVLKINNITPIMDDSAGSINHNISNTSNAISSTFDKLWILSPSEIGAPIIKDYISIYGNIINANLHYYNNAKDSYKDTLLLAAPKRNRSEYYMNDWYTNYNMLYSNSTYQWWMLPTSSHKMSNGSQAYHNTDYYSYCTLIYKYISPSTNERCDYGENNDGYFYRFVSTSSYYGVLSFYYDYNKPTIISANDNSGVVLAFAF